MATTNDLKSRVTDLVTCSICLDMFDTPKSLPCLHTFCLKCIEGHCRDNEPGDELACPICRQKFTIPDNGVRELISNFFIADLVDARKTSKCSSVVMEAELIHKDKQVGKCDKHADEDVKLYCLDCKKNLCVICFAEEHQQHKCKNVVTVAAECAKQIDLDLAALQELVEKAQYERRRLDWQKHVFLASVTTAEKKIADRGEELKQLIDKEVNERLQEVQSLKSEVGKTIDSCVDDIEMRLVAFETFSAYCSELEAKGKPSDITRAANDLHTRATELQQTGATLTDLGVPCVMFEPKNIGTLFACGQTVIGEVTVRDIDVNTYDNLNGHPLLKNLETLDFFRGVNDKLKNLCTTSRIPVHCKLANSNDNKLTQFLDKQLQVMISAALRSFANDPESTKDWNSILSTLKTCDQLEEIPADPKVPQRLVDGYDIHETNRFKFDGSADKAKVNEFKKWFDGFIGDLDVSTDTQIDVACLASQIAETGVHVDSFASFWTDSDYTENSVTDTGLLRFPEKDQPYIKVYHIEVTVRRSCKRILFAQADRNSVKATFEWAKFRPTATAMAQLQPKILELLNEDTIS